MSFGAFDTKHFWRWAGPRYALIELPNGAVIEVALDKAAYDYIEFAESLGVPNAAESADIHFKREGDDFSTMTRYGNAAGLLATVADIVRSYVRRVEPGFVMFLAHGARARVYEHMLKRIDLLGYRLYREAGESKQYGRTYVLLRQSRDVPPRDVLEPVE